MEPPDPFESADDDTHGQMMRATYDALRKHGYADLTIQRIGDEFPKSKSLVYQHYDGKDELLVDFLDLMLDHFESGFQGVDDPDPRERLRRVLDHTLAPDVPDEQRAFTRAMTALRGQATHDAAFRDHFTETEAVFRSHFAAIVRDGVEAGTFRHVDPDAVAEYVATTLHGAMFRRATTNEAMDVTAVRRELDAYLDARLGLGDGG